MTKKIFVISIIYFSYVNNAHAYLDPSTGGMLISAILGMFATLGLVIKSYWRSEERRVGKECER